MISWNWNWGDGEEVRVLARDRAAALLPWIRGEKRREERVLVRDWVWKRDSPQKTRKKKPQSGLGEPAQSATGSWK